MNNNIERINKGLAKACLEYISVAYRDSSAKAGILKGGGSNGGLMTKLLMPRPINSIRISQAALEKCLEFNVFPLDFFLLTRSQRDSKYSDKEQGYVLNGNDFKKFFSSNAKSVEEAHKVNQFVTWDHNIPNLQMIENMFRYYGSNPKCDVLDFKRILNDQSYDLITVEENDALKKAGLNDKGDKSLRDSYCSKKFEFVDMWLTPPEVIEEFFKVSGLNRSECLDPCACDDRWLKGEGQAADILPMNRRVVQQDFLTFDKNELSSGIKYVVGNLPFSLTKDFVNKALSLVDDCYFLVNGDTIFSYFPNHIKEVFIFSGLEGNQKDNRSRCEFEVPFLVRSALWCCIVHITKEEQKPWKIEKNLSKEQRRDGNHIAIGWNTFIDCEKPVDDFDRVKRIQVKSSIEWSGGKRFKVDGKMLDIYDFYGSFKDEDDED